MTGNLSVYRKCEASLLTKGPSYREPNPINWIKVFQQLKKGVDDCQKTWCNKEQVDRRVLSKWKNRLLHAIKIEIESLKKDSSFPTRTNQILEDEVVKTYLQDFQKSFVITPTDKAGNNVSIVCKKFYLTF